MRLLLGSLLLSLAFASAQPITPGPGDTLTFSIDRAGPPLAQFDIALNGATGRGTYTTRASSGSTGNGASSGSATPIAVGAPLLKQLFAVIPAVTNHRCESHSRNLAQTGKKTLRFTHTDASAECTYNYSDDERVNAATDLFLALAQTIDFGQRLATKLRFDRLGLDTEIDELDDAVKSNRAVELGNIARVLQAIANDDRVMERVQRKAASLLERAGLRAVQPSGEAAPSER